MDSKQMFKPWAALTAKLLMGTVKSGKIPSATSSGDGNKYIRIDERKFNKSG